MGLQEKDKVEKAEDIHKSLLEEATNWDLDIWNPRFMLLLFQETTPSKRNLWVKISTVQKFWELRTCKEFSFFLAENKLQNFLNLGSNLLSCTAFSVACTTALNSEDAAHQTL